MPKVFADIDHCESYGNCAMTAPDVFDLDDDGVVVLLRDEVSEAERRQVQEAVGLCPVNALRLGD